HEMHVERYVLPEEAARRINAADRVLAVGTTTVRVLESQPPGPLRSAEGSTSLFIRPPFTFHHTSCLLTNFHLPRSTLLMLVSAFAGRELILEAYRQAVRLRYRFFSYGDCMLIL
ncbi:MAG: S-adenosylmethionine:tRNA ribosyltransferase-isomerase, partial [Terrimicrobiaceae bacterium]|nr:S-adenosylmethionine:tRNA ribosyltransferase-isomerase [Terrimicrobiaceae bacterium]